ncbi:zinc dependent phospholipase C family protein [[Clostridium] polysaccharolyticum]|uniref:Zinc dependent phospholipase C n=1 Tax=[Clostridium] polysaccharolyticum TaxID=29364 RepID=A0A1I0B5B3_9FIRM|nr:zinc dependent phospholipase C family protein [[Clostridium] polysaccharolyticum]SET01698.1 Zinc dependent phospholipase C [[Clostridium] polysaccharolyticum]
MPAFFTHYAFCVDNYKKLKNNFLKSIIKEHRKAYALGAIGPDIFFYYFPDIRRKEKKPGNLLHENFTQRFFEHMLKRAEIMPKKKQRIAYAYIAGFICHYQSDVHCHPFVYEESAWANPHIRNEKHFALEGAMEVYCCYERLHRLPTELDQRSLIKINKEERNVIATLLADAYNTTYIGVKQSKLRIQRILWFVRAVIWALEDKKGRKERIWTRLEKWFTGYNETAPLFINNNTYAYTVEDWYVFSQYYKKGLKSCENIMLYFTEYLEKTGDKRRMRSKLLEELGDESYHNGKIFS